MLRSGKTELKLYEKAFFQATGRKPTRADILEDKVVLRKYKTFGQVK